jgi:pantoate--beta-alanine ligase
LAAQEAAGLNLKQMNIFKKAVLLEAFLEKKRAFKQQIGFVPTMGALHAGHISLLQESLRQNDVTVCSVFVNPTQFNDPDDFSKYPSTPAEDIYMLESAGCDVLFLPAVSEIYPQGTQELRTYDLGFLDTVLEAKFRPGHFQGVCQVVHRLLNQILPHHLYMGQKDYQQCMVIQKLLSLVQLDTKITLHVMPTVRESDGLAMSSRNKRLHQQARAKAPVIFQTLQFIKENLRPGNTEIILQQGWQLLQQAGLQTEYLQLANANSLTPIHDWDGKEKAVVLTAVYLDNVRLIDNLLIN